MKILRHLAGRRCPDIGALNRAVPHQSTDSVALDNEASSAFVVKDRLPRHGWNMIEMALEHSEATATVLFYFDCGQGYQDEDSLSLPVHHGRLAKRLCYIPPKLQSIRVEVLESKGELYVEHFCFVWLTPWFAQDRLSQRLANMHFLFRGMSKSAVFKSIKTSACDASVAWQDVALARYNETFSKRCPMRGYHHWIDKVERLRTPNDATVKRKINEFSMFPVVSIILPVFNSNEIYLAKCIDSVLGQSYPYWQLCIVDDASTNPALRPFLGKYVSSDKRIELVVRESNGHISAASNSALSIVQGDYVLLLDHDDALSSHALLMVVEAINANPEAAVLYSDEDKVDISGVRFEPHFKPDFNLDLLLSQNYISHLGVYKTSLVREVGGFREGLEGSQDYDLLLRCFSEIDASKVVHIPEILYHWRAVEGSTADKPSEKSYASSAGMVAISNYLEITGNDASVEPGPEVNTYRVKWRMPSQRPLVSLMIPTRDGYDILKRCVDSILAKTSYDRYEVIILNNQSRCPLTLKYLEEISGDNRVVIYDWDFPFNYSAINNFGATVANGEILGLLNNDVEVINPDWLDEMVSHVCRDDIGCVGAMLYYPNDAVQHAGVILGIGGVAGHAHKYFTRNERGYFARLKLVQNLSAVTGACLLVRKSIFVEVGGLDEDNLPVAFNDVDFCLKVRQKGYRNLWTPYAELYHHESVSRGADNTLKKRARARREAEFMRKKWGKLLDHDPAYNINLTLVHEDFSLR